MGGGGGGEGTPNNGLYRETPPERGAFYKARSILKGHQKLSRNLYLQESILFGYKRELRIDANPGLT